ncbi:MAG: tetratricopeptide repeat protein [Agarilytica sp.]
MAAITLRISALLFAACLVTSCSFLKSNKKAKREKQRTLDSAEELRYRVALYHYYQGDYVAALTELLIAKARGGIKGHGDNPEIMEGGFSLGFGLERHASEIFERLLQENRSKRSQDAAWFFLSKLRYLRNDWEQADVALSRVRNRPAAEIRNEVYVHRINLALQQNKLDEAAQLLKKRTPGVEWLPYVYYNIGAAYARAGDFDAALKYFEKLTFDQYPTDELRALYDKAMTAAGYAYLITKQYEKAIEQFSLVRLTSAHSNRALLGYGWAAAELGNFKEALKPWSYLAKSSLADENSQEALIAVPYAYEKLGSENLALEHFRLAEETFLAEMKRLEGVIESMQGEQFLAALKIKRSSGMDWLKNVRENQVSPQLGYLAELFSQEDFQGVVQELRDLVGIREDFLVWQDKLQFYRDLISQQQVGRAKKAEELAARELSDAIKSMKAKRSKLAQRIERIASKRDYFALANAEEKEYIDRVLRSRRNIKALRETDPFIDESEEAVRRYYGVLLWDAADKYSDRLWRAVKTLNLLDKTLATVTRNHEKVQYLIDNPQDLDPIQVRLENAQLQLDSMSARVDDIIIKTQDDLRVRTTAVLENQRTRLNHYIAQSRLSMARLYDKSLQSTFDFQKQKDGSVSAQLPELPKSQINEQEQEQEGLDAELGAKTEEEPIELDEKTQEETEASLQEDEEEMDEEVEEQTLDGSINNEEGS